MCGIAGILCAQADGELSSASDSVLRLLQHRGPDDHGWLLLSPQGVRRGRGRFDARGAEAILLHRRLSILDPSPAGWQPMGTPDGAHFIVYNGEIYNYLELRAELEARGHVFRSQSDTEVLLHAFVEWGSAALDRLVGMFAFAVLDVPGRRLFLARDFFGIKPLYYTVLRDGFAFASEIKALLELPGLERQVNAGRLYEYLRWGKTDHGAETLFADVQQLPAAHWLEIALDRPGDIRPVRYWQIDGACDPDLSLEQAAIRLRELFLASVRLHLRSDVPVGAALSGGIDSSAIVAVMRAVEPNLDLHTFSYLADDPGLSEQRWVQLAGTRAGAVLHTVQPTPDELVADLDQLVYLQDEPFGSTSIYAQHRVFRLARAAGIGVMLDGQGADEMLGGYRSYLAARLASLVRQGRFLEAGRFALKAARLPGAGGLLRVLVQSGSLLCPRGKGLALKFTGRAGIPAGLNTDWFMRQGVTTWLPPPGHGSKAVLHAQLRQTLVDSSLPMLLRYEDRNSMAFSIESRVPFLTPALVSFLMRLPEEYIIAADGTSKNVFRRAMRGIVPDAVLDRRDKIGFATPERNWLATLRPWVERTLRSEAARSVPALDGAGMQADWQAVLAGRRRFDFRIWRWLNLVRWAERFAVEFAA